MNTHLIIRHRDRAIFERDADGFLRRVKYVPRRWWQFHGRFERAGGTWYPQSEKEYDVIAREYVEAGCKELHERTMESP